MFRMICLWGCCCLAMMMSGGISYAGEPEVQKEGFAEFVCDKNFFKAQIPSDWEANEEIIDGRTLKEYGVDVKGPKNEQGAFTSISIFYFGPDHGRFKNLEAYLKAQTTIDDMDRVLNNKVDPVVEVAVSGRPARQFDRYNSLLLPIYSVEQVKVPMRERLVVVPAKKGFYVLEYSSSVDLFDEYLKVFEGVLAGFRPNV